MKLRVLTLVSIFLSLSTTLSAQNGRPSPAEMEKQLYEYVEKEVNKYESILNLKGWQVFYADSILTHNLKAMQAEYNDYADRKVSNADLYQKVADKWNEKTFVAMRAILNDQQWAKYLKAGAAREKKARDKRAAKRN